MLGPRDLHDYQRRTVRFALDHPGCALWLDMGLGKTVSTLTAVSELLDQFDARRVLVVAPLRVAEDVWQPEARRWSHLAHLDIGVATGSAEARTRTVLADHDITVINRENLIWLVRGHGREWPYDTVVLDEASSFKSQRSKRWRAMRSVMPALRRMIQLTATPASQTLDSLWPQMFLLDGGARLGRTQSAFRDRWMTPDRHGFNFTVTDEAAEAEIYAAVSDIVLRLDASDYLTMPPLNEIDRTVTIPARARKAYEQIERELVLLIQRDDGSQAEAVAQNAAVLVNKLIQIANGHVYDVESSAVRLHDAKLRALTELREETDEPMLVAFAFREDERLLREQFPDARSITEPGAIDAWNRGAIPMLLAHPASAGHGLNLQRGGALLVWYGLTWSAEQYQQTIGRLYRQGQTRPVTVVRLLAKDTADERVAARLRFAMSQQGRLLDTLRAVYLDH